MALILDMAAFHVIGNFQNSFLRVFENILNFIAELRRTVHNVKIIQENVLASLELEEGNVMYVFLTFGTMDQVRKFIK